MIYNIVQLEPFVNKIKLYPFLNVKINVINSVYKYKGQADKVYPRYIISVENTALKNGTEWSTRNFIKFPIEESKVLTMIHEVALTVVLTDLENIHSKNNELIDT